MLVENLGDEPTNRPSKGSDFEAFLLEKDGKDVKNLYLDFLTRLTGVSDRYKKVFSVDDEWTEEDLDL